MLPENVYQIFYDQCAYDIPFLLYKRTQAPKLHVAHLPLLECGSLAPALPVWVRFSVQLLHRSIN
jgi:hypothetical protein